MGKPKSAPSRLPDSDVQKMTKKQPTVTKTPPQAPPSGTKAGPHTTLVAMDEEMDMDPPPPPPLASVAAAAKSSAPLKLPAVETEAGKRKRLKKRTSSPLSLGTSLKPKLKPRAQLISSRSPHASRGNVALRATLLPMVTAAVTNGLEPLITAMEAGQAAMALHDATSHAIGFADACLSAAHSGFPAPQVLREFKTLEARYRSKKALILKLLPDNAAREALLNDMRIAWTPLDNNRKVLEEAMSQPEPVGENGRTTLRGKVFPPRESSLDVILDVATAPLAARNAALAAQALLASAPLAAAAPAPLASAPSAAAAAAPTASVPAIAAASASVAVAAAVPPAPAPLAAVPPPPPPAAGPPRAARWANYTAGEEIEAASAPPPPPAPKSRAWADIVNSPPRSDVVEEVELTKALEESKLMQELEELRARDRAGKLPPPLAPRLTAAELAVRAKEAQIRALQAEVEQLHAGQAKAATSAISPGAVSDTSGSDGDDAIDARPALLPARARPLRMPQPAKFSGERSDEVIEDVLFSFENYLDGIGAPRDRWPTVAMQLLEKKALAAYIAFAQPLQSAGVAPTWEQFKGLLSQTYSHPDRQLASRQLLLQVSQTGSVSEYLQHVRLLVSRAGLPAPTDRDLLLLYWQGLKPHIRDQCKVDPTTGAFWATFESLARHTVTVDNQRIPSAARSENHFRRKKPFTPRVAAATTATASLKAVPPAFKQQGKPGTSRSARSTGSDKSGRPSKRHAPSTVLRTCDKCGASGNVAWPSLNHRDGCSLFAEHQQREQRKKDEAIKNGQLRFH